MIAKVRALIKDKGLEVIAVDSEASVTQAVDKMVERNIGAVLVMEDGSPVGMFTERDVLKCWKAHEGFDVPVKNFMSKNLIVLQADDDLSYAMSIMIQKGVRHLPVVDKHSVVSVLSIRDVVRAQVSSLQAEVHYLKEFISSAG